MFSLQVPVPPKIFLSLVYKLEGPSNVRVALEFTIGDTGSCHIGGISALNGEGRVSPFSGRLREDECRRRTGRGELVLAVLGHPASADRAAGASCGQGDSPVSQDLSAAQPAVWGWACACRDWGSGPGLLPAMALREDVPGVREKPGQ